VVDSENWIPLSYCFCFLHGCVLILFFYEFYSIHGIFSSHLICVFLFFWLVLMQGLGVTSIKKEPMHAAVVTSLLHHPFLVYSLYLFI
jgi:hypothetical protein